MESYQMNLQVKFKLPGFADCDIEIHAKGFLAVSVYWGNQDGPLPGWSAFAVFPIDPAGIGKYHFEGKRSIPENATHIYAKCIALDFCQTEEVLEEIPKPFLPEKKYAAPIAVFSIFSDLHLSGKPGRVYCTLRAANGNILIPGDLTNDGYEEQFQIFKKCIEETVTDKLVLSVTGNHDQLLKTKNDKAYFRYEAFQDYLFHRAEQLKYYVERDDSGAYAVSYGAIDIIGLQCVSEGRKFGLSSGRQLEWLEHHLNNTPHAKWHIIMCHAPLLAHNPHRNEGQVYFAGNNALQRIMDEHHNIIFVSGHTHVSPNTCRGNVEYIPETKTVYIDDGSVAPTELKGEPLMPSEWHDGMIAEMQIFDEFLDITYKSVHTGMSYPRGYYRLAG